MYIKTDYLHNCLNPSELIGRVAVAREKLSHVDYDAIACRGSSGMIFAGALSAATGKPIVLVRKPHEVYRNTGDSPTSHSTRNVEGPADLKSYVFVDEIISEGTTQRAVIDGLKSFAPNAYYAGTYLYNKQHFTPNPQPRAEKIPPKEPTNVPDTDANTPAIKPLPKLTIDRPYYYHPATWTMASYTVPCLKSPDSLGDYGTQSPLDLYPAAPVETSPTPKHSSLDRTCEPSA